MVNNAFRQFVHTFHDEATWDAIAEAAAVQATPFANTSAYDDTVTLAIVGAVARHLDRPVEDVLREAGKYYISYVQDTDFAAIYKTSGRTLFEKVCNLDQMHRRIRMSLPDLMMPHFEVEETEDGIEVTYESRREGLFPFVEGLLHGMALDTGQTIEVTSFEQTGPGSGRWSLRLA